MDHIKKETFGVAFIVILLLIAPGFTALFYFFRELFVSLETLKVIILSISIVTPFLVINSALFSQSLEKDEDSPSKGAEENMFLSLTYSAVLSACIVYTALFFSYLLNLSLQITIFVGFGIQLFLVLFRIYRIMSKKKTK